MIDKITPRGLDKSSDHKLVSKASMIDAVNVYIADDYVNDEGNAGVLKSVRGNVEIQYASDADRPTYENAHTKVIGSVTDNKTKIVYLFIWSQYLEDHGVWAYDPFGKIPTSTNNPIGQPNTLRKVLTTGPGQGGLPPVGGFQFPEHGFVKGDIVYTNTNTLERYPIIRDYLNDFTSESLKIDFEKDVLIYFTDNVNEPRRLNPYRCLLERTDTYGEIDNYNFINQWDLICACPKVPLERISFTWDSDGDKFTNNFLTTPGFQYAYQTIYKDGLESSISTYSKIAFAPSVVNRGAADLVSLLTHNVCVLQIPEVSSEISSIRILARYGNSSNFFEIDEVPIYNDPYSIVNPETYNDNWNPATRTYRFRNDRVGFGVSPREVDKTFDAVPRKAQAQTTISNRLVFGNYLENFDNIQTDCTSRVNYQTRPPDYLNYTIEVDPSIHRTPFGNNKCVGFDLDTSQFSSQVYEGTEITVTINYTPDKNFHIYQANGSYHQSRQVGKRSGNVAGYKRWPFHTQNNNFPGLGQGDNQNLNSGSSFGKIPYWPNTPAEKQELGNYSEANGPHVWQAYDKAFAWGGTGLGPENSDGLDQGVRYLQEHLEKYFGRNYGVGSDGNDSTETYYFYSGANALGSEANLPVWRHDVDLNNSLNYNTFSGGNVPLENTQIGSELTARYGTSAGNPLILQGTTLQFMVRFRITQDELYNGRKVIGETVVEALAGAQEGDYSWGFCTEVLEVTNTQRVEIDLGLYNQEEQSNYNFPQIRSGVSEPGDPYSYLICGVGEGRASHNTISKTDSCFNISDETRSTHIPMSYFIVNKAEVDFYLEWVNPTELDYPNNEWTEEIYDNTDSGTRMRMRLGISRLQPELGPDGIMTCVRKYDPRSPWWVIGSDVLSNTTFQAALESGSDIVQEAFQLPDPLFAPAPPPYTTLPEDQVSSFLFLAQFTTNFWTLHGHGQWCQRRPWGYMDTSGGNSFFKPHQGGNAMYQPTLYNGSKFRFSIMDGEGGPGGTSAGTDSAYDKYGNKNWGSIAGRVDLSWDYQHCILTGKKVDDPFTTAMGVSMQQKNFQAYMGGMTYGGGTAIYIQDQDVMDELELQQDFIIYPDPDTGLPAGSVPNTPAGITSLGAMFGVYVDWESFPTAASVKYLVSGPFFTGSIAMNAIAEGDNNVQEPFANPQGSPQTKCYTTTLPLIWVNSRGVGLSTWEGEYLEADSDGFLSQGTTPPNWCRTPYPWPQTQAFLEGIDVYEGDLPSFPTDPLPFSLDYSYHLDSDGNTEDLDNPIHPNGGYGDDSSPRSHSFFGGVSFSELQSHIECVGVSSFNDESQGNNSFKTSATHEFGIVYYDERGRHGAVNHLDSVYVGGYSKQERGGDYQGAVSVSLTLNHEPPEWATNWKIAYSKNTSVSDFVQYSAGGAFVREGVYNSNDPSSIYVSLNHLQGRPISYTHAWGASNENIELTDSTMPLMYTFTKGDRIRVISYMSPPIAGSSSTNVPPRQYPLGYEFEVADMVSLGAENNPLITTTEASDDFQLDPEFNEKQGLFLVVKNNTSAAGFRFEDVKDGSHNWGDNCIIEIYSPTKELDADDRLYYEVGELGTVLRTGNDVGPQRTHYPQTLEITEGDVYFRRAAVNMREYDFSGEYGMAGYEPLIVNVIEEDPETPEIEQRGSESNFKSYYIESPVASDLFKSDSLSIGRPNAIDHDARETYREASVIHSDRDVTEAGKVSYSSFNNSLAIDKDLDLKSGGVNYLANHDDSIFLIQKDKCGHLPIDRTLISDVLGEESLIASSNFMGTPRYYVGKAGADDNPESVVNVDNTTYFAHKSLGKVFRASGVNGVNAISDIGMNSYFREVFNNAMAASMSNGHDVRVVGGYDPIQSEYLVSILNPVTYGLAGASDVINAPSFDLCLWLQETEDQLGINWFEFGQQTVQGYYSYVSDIANYINNESDIDLWGTLPFPVSNYVGQDINTFIEVYLLNESGGLIQFAQETEDGVIIQVTCAEPGYDDDTGEAWDPCGEPYFSYTNGYNPYQWINADGSINMEIVNQTDIEGILNLPEGYTQQDVINDILNGGYNLPGACPIPPIYVKDDFNPCSYNGNGLPETSPDYIPPIYNEVGEITELSVSALYEVLQSRISEGLMTVAEATYYFPNTMTNEDIGGGQQEVQLNGSDFWFAINNAVGITCPIPPPPHDPDPDVDEPEPDPDVDIVDEGDPVIDDPDPDPDFEEPDVGLEDDPFTEDDYYQDPQVNLEDEDLEPLTWTENFCDYPLLASPQNPDAITLDSIQFAYSQVLSQLNLGTITQEQATYLFPDLTGDGQITSADMFYVLNNSTMFPISCAVEPPPPPPIDPLPWTGNFCDYPMLVATSLEIVNVDTITSAFYEVTGQIGSGAITQAEATYLFPDVSGDGQIDIDDITSILSMPAEQFPISCAVEPPPPPPPTDPLPYTGNMCDYPALINSQGNIVTSSVQNAYNTVLAQLEAGEITQIEATYIVPDIFANGIISTPDFASALNQVTIAGGSITCEIPGLPLEGDVRTPDKDPVESRKQTQNRRRKEKQKKNQKKGTSGTSSPNRRY